MADQRYSLRRVLALLFSVNRQFSSEEPHFRIQQQIINMAITR